MTLFPYTRENHFQFGYRNGSTLKTRWLNRRETKHEEFIAKYGRSKSAQTTWRDANAAAAMNILEIATARRLTTVVCCSGGLDSEITLLSFFAAWSKLPSTKRPPLEVATLDFDDELNRHDTQYVEKFIEKHKPKGLELSVRRYALDIRRFLTSPEFVQLADEAQVISPAVVAQLWLCQEIHRANKSALPVIGQGEMHLVRAESPQRGRNLATESSASAYEPAPWSLVETENLCGLYRFFIGRGIPAIPGFFQYLPEQFETQLRTNSVMHELISNSRTGKLGTRTSKAEILALEYPELEARPKYTGFEKIEPLYDERRAFLLARPLATEAKWLQPVFDLYADLRPTTHTPVSVADWNFAWGRDGVVTSIRTSSDDVFATQWSDPSMLKSVFEQSATAINLSIATSAREFLSICASYLKRQSSTSSPMSLMHDGSRPARLFRCILKREFGNGTKYFEPRAALLPSETQLVTLVLASGSTDSELLTRLILKNSIAYNSASGSAQTRVLLPFLHGRIVNAEFDRELDSTLIRPRFVWTENESLAALTAAQNICPWTDASLAEALIRATRSTGWFDGDEPGPSNRTALENFFDRCLELLEETNEDRELATKCAREYAKLKSEIQQHLVKLAMTSPRFQVSSYDLQSYSTDSFDLVSAVGTPGESRTSASVLKIVLETTWLHHAKLRVPELRLGSNLFYQQKISGLALLEKNLRLHFGLTVGNAEVAWAQLIVLKNAPTGRLRIRGVTTRLGSERKGHATDLLTKLTSHLRVHAQTHLNGFTSVDVYAAPEVVKAFRAAGFIDDVSRVTRAEEIIDPDSGQLVATDRELTPLTFSLGET